MSKTPATEIEMLLRRAKTETKRLERMVTAIRRARLNYEMNPSNERLLELEQIVLSAEEVTESEAGRDILTLTENG
jgi:hypothetical protein